MSSIPKPDRIEDVYRDIGACLAKAHIDARDRADSGLERAADEVIE